MSEQWCRDYVLLALRINNVLRAVHSWFDDPYYGPPEWKATVDQEPKLPAADLVRAATALADALPAQGFEQRRGAYLGKQVRAMETFCRKAAGERLALADEVERTFDVRPEWVPEATLERALALYDEALPGEGSLSDRFLAWSARHELASGKPGLLASMVERTLAEIRRRTRLVVELPENEGVEVAIVSEKPYTAVNGYLGNYRSRLELNTDLPTNVALLPDLLCHEGYPGHHTEAVMKERHLYRGRGFLDESVALMMSPQTVIAEGIATVAADTVFAPGEMERWLGEHVYPELGVEADAADLAKLRMARILVWGAWGNAAFMLHEEGRPDDEVVRYLTRYTLTAEERTRKLLDVLKAPLLETYVFTYFWGWRLTQPLLQYSDHLAVSRRLLTEQTYPSLLTEWAEPSRSA